MLTRVILVLFLKLAVFHQELPAQDSLTQEFQNVLDQALPQGFSGIAVAETDGEIVAIASVGHSDEQNKQRIDSRTLFEIGSVTKPFTALAVIILERQKKLSLDDSIAEYLPNVSDDCKGITIRHLMQHTSGIPGTNYGPHSKDVQLVTEAYLNGGPKVKPGSRYEYWNQGYALLAAIIAKASGKTYQKAMQDLVLKPAGMQFSCFNGDIPVDGVAVAIGKSSLGANRSALDHPYGDFYGLQYQGMGGLVTNIEDMIRFLKALRKSKSNVEKMVQPGPNGVYGLGWMIEQINDKQRRVYHSGSVRGFLTAVSWYPETSSSLIVLANIDNKKAFFFVESNVRKAFEKTIIELPPNQKFENDFRKSIVGQYQLQRRLITVSEAGDGLEMVIDWGGPKTFGKLEKTEAKSKLRYLDGSKEKVFVHVKRTGSKIKALEILNSQYTRKR